ncbi:MAG: pyridoxal phosphate-dependent aminotransferase [Planctomycetota bacterium]|jgi:aspartate aminotransferase
MLSERVKNVPESITLKLTAKAKGLKAAGHDVVGFGAGELSFPPPACVGEAMSAALARGETGYTHVAGKLSLREIIAWHLKRDTGQVYAPDDVLVSCGAKHSLFNICQTLLQEGDEALIPAPYWVSYPAMVGLAGGRSVFVSHGKDLKVDLEALAGAITDRSRILFLNSPSNPTGAVYTFEELTALAEVVRGHEKLMVVSDEIYNRLVFDGEEAPAFLKAAPDLASRTIVVNGISKQFAMTGFRVGWAAGPREVISGAKRLQSHSTSGVSSIMQAAAESVLREAQGFLASVMPELRGRRDAMVTALRALPGVTLDPPPAGAFYAFPDVSGLFGRTLAGKPIESAMDLCNRLLDHAGAAIVPGEGFGAPRNARLSFALPGEAIERGLGRVRAYLEENLE